VLAVRRRLEQNDYSSKLELTLTTRIKCSVDTFCWQFDQ